MPRKTKRAGAGVLDVLKNAHKIVKDKKLLSKLIDMAGYGAKPKRKRAPAKKGGFFGFLKPILKPIARPVINAGMDMVGLGNKRGGWKPTSYVTLPHQRPNYAHGDLLMNRTDRGGAGKRGGSRVMALGNVYDPTPRGVILA